MAACNFRFLILRSVPESVHTLSTAHLLELLSNVHALNVKRGGQFGIPNEVISLFS